MTATLDCLDLIFNEEEDNIATDLTLVGKLISTKIIINSFAIIVVLHSTWNLGPNVSFKALGQNMVTYIFKNSKDRQRIENVGPWSIKGHLLNLQQWDPSLSLNEVDFSVCKVWVQIHNSPPNRLNTKNLQRIGKLLGDHDVIDETHLKFGMSRFVRLRVAINVTKALKPGCFIPRETGDQLWLAFKYEWISDICYTCGRITHTEQVCPESQPVHTDDREEYMGFGPWMRATRHSNTRNHAPHTGKPNRKEKP